MSFAPLSTAVPRTIGAKLANISWPVLAVLSLLAFIGIGSLYSVAGGSFAPYADRHALRFLLTVAMVIVIAMTPLHWWLQLAFPAYGIALLLLALVPLVGIDALGARRWLGFRGFTFQPSELMKVALVLMLARYYQWLGAQRVSRPQWVLVPIALIAMPVVLTLKQPDLGTAALFAVVGLSMMFLAGVNLLYFAGGVAGALAAAPLVWMRLHDYQRRRIEIFLDPERDPLGAGYHITQSKIALGSGGAAGKGFLAGTQSQLDFLPEKHTDFIFTAFGEEWGFTGGVALIALYGLLAAMMLWLAFGSRSQFGRLVTAGAGLILFLYAFINIAMVTGLVPVVGVPLPLVSYGGTSMTTIMFAIGIAMCAIVNRAQGIRNGG